MGTALPALALGQVFPDAGASIVWTGTIRCASGTAASDADRAVLVSYRRSLFD